jgi:monoamine oxidase
MALTRRQFLSKVGMAGGYGAAFTLMQSLGLLPVPEANAQAVKPRNGKGTKVVILGGGIAGLVAAWEMGKLGYDCTLLEARKRVGGRNWTIRNGSTIDFVDGIKQHCSFEEGNYFNAGPARLPSIHKTILGYCREFNVPLEVEINTSRSALLQADSLNKGSAVEQRRVIYDTRGHVSELLAKCTKQGLLDKELTQEDSERMIEFLRGYGNLDADLVYKGSPSAGYAVYPGAGPDEGSLNPPLSMHQLLDADLWTGVLAEDTLDWQATMFQPIGGMDQIPRAFEARLAGVIRHEAEVTQIRQTSSGVSVEYKDGKAGSTNSVEADYCICALPLTILKSVKSNLSADVRHAIQEVTYDSAYKIAWESPRFWETDYHIYGGISYLRQTVDVVWYPSAKLFTPTGVVVGGYSIEDGSTFGKLPSIDAKLAASRYAVEKLHPGYSQKLMNPIYISWGQIPYNLGSWVSGVRQKEEPKDYKKFTKPDGRVFFAGDHTSHLIGWQEGAALSAIRAVNMIGDRVHEERPHAG